MKFQFKILLCFVYTIAWSFTKAQNDINVSSITVEFRTISIAPATISNSVFNSNNLQFKRSFQSLNFDKTPSKDDYLLKSRHQKTIAWIMLGGGVALTTLGIAVSQANGIDYALGSSSNKNTGGTVLAVAGIASALGSIPVFISAAHNKRRAAELTFNMQQMPSLSVATKHQALFQPALKISIPFN